SLDLNKIAPLVIGIGAVILLVSKKKKTRDIASIAVGFGILFMGMDLMGSSMDPVAESQWFKDFILIVSDRSLLGFLAGLGLTAIIQSSAGTTVILIALASTGAIDMRLAFPVILGCNIGTCVTALLSSLGTS